MAVDVVFDEALISFVARDLGDRALAGRERTIAEMKVEMDRRSIAPAGVGSPAPPRPPSIL